MSKQSILLKNTSADAEVIVASVKCQYRYTFSKQRHLLHSSSWTLFILFLFIPHNINIFDYFLIDTTELEYHQIITSEFWKTSILFLLSFGHKLFFPKPGLMLNSERYHIWRQSSSLTAERQSIYTHKNRDSKALLQGPKLNTKKVRKGEWHCYFTAIFSVKPTPSK